MTGRGFENGNVAAVTHGGYSPRLVAAKARAHRRRFLRNLGVKASDLDGLASEWLRQWSIGAAKVDLLPPDSGDSWTAFNSTARVLRRLEERLRELGLVQGRAVVAPGANGAASLPPSSLSLSETEEAKP